MDVSELLTITGAAAAAGICRTTLLHAVNAGHVASEATADGLPLVRLADVLAYKAHPPKMGRPPKAEKAPA